MNVLVTSISKKVPLLFSVREAVKNGVLFGADSSSHVIGKYFVDEFWVMPNLNKLSLDILINYCKEKEISAIIPTRDGELKYFAKYKDFLNKNGVSIMVSNIAAIDVCSDKQKFYEFGIQKGFPVIPTDKEISQISTENYVVKERHGSGSNGLGLDLSKNKAERFAHKLINPVYQPYIAGKEYSIDVYVNKQSKGIGSIVRSRDLIVNGESQVTTLINHPKLEKISLRFAEALSLYGHSVFQAIEKENGDIYFIECNPRFGGASTLSIQAGLHSFDWYLLEASGKGIVPEMFYKQRIPLKMVRYPKDYFMN